MSLASRCKVIKVWANCALVNDGCFPVLRLVVVDNVDQFKRYE